MLEASEINTTAVEEERHLPLPSTSRLQELLFDAARLGRDDMILPLIHAGARISEPDSKGYTALILASYHGHSAATAMLLDQGAAIDQSDAARGNTALMGVAFKGYTALADQLLAAGADPHAVNHAGQTALMMAALFGREAIAKLLLDRGANPDQKDAAGNSAISVAAAQSNLEMMQWLGASPSE